MNDISKPLTEAAGGSWILRWLLIAILTLIAIIFILLIIGFEVSVAGGHFRIRRPTPTDDVAVTRAELAQELQRSVRYGETVTIKSKPYQNPTKILTALGLSGPDLGAHTRIETPNNSDSQKWIIETAISK